MYLLDANAFMEANRLYYAFDIAPGFWTWLGDPSLTGEVPGVQVLSDRKATRPPRNPPRNLRGRPNRRHS